MSVTEPPQRVAVSGEAVAGPAHPAIARAYYSDVAAFEENAARNFPQQAPHPAASGD